MSKTYINDDGEIIGMKFDNHKPTLIDRRLCISEDPEDDITHISGVEKYLQDFLTEYYVISYTGIGKSADMSEKIYFRALALAITSYIDGSWLKLLRTGCC